MQISDLNRKIIINSFAFGVTNFGGNSKILTGAYETWAKVEPNSGNRALDNLQIEYQQSFTITKRFELSRPLNNTDEIVYENNLLSIASVKEVEEGKKKWYEIIAYSTGRIFDNSILPVTGFFWEVVEW